MALRGYGRSICFRFRTSSRRSEPNLLGRCGEYPHVARATPLVAGGGYHNNTNDHARHLNSPQNCRKVSAFRIQENPPGSTPIGAAGSRGEQARTSGPACGVHCPRPGPEGNIPVDPSRTLVAAGASHRVQHSQRAGPSSAKNGAWHAECEAGQLVAGRHFMLSTWICGQCNLPGSAGLAHRVASAAVGATE